MQINYFKAIIALACLVAVSILMIANSINSDAGMPIITMIVGYAIGNGITASQGKDSEPIVRSKKTNSHH